MPKPRNRNLRTTQRRREIDLDKLAIGMVAQVRAEYPDADEAEALSDMLAGVRVAEGLTPTQFNDLKWKLGF